jgi:hypothetical protein
MSGQAGSDCTAAQICFGSSTTASHGGSLGHGPYFFPDLADTTATDEQAAIDAGEVQPTRIDWVGTAR